MSPADKELLEKLRSIHRFASKQGTSTIFGDAVELINRCFALLTERTDTATRASKALDEALLIFEEDGFDHTRNDEIADLRLTATYCANMLP